MGREELVSLVVRVAVEEGIRTWTVEYEVEDPELIVLGHWSLLDDATDLILSNPGADVVFGQDLCHQVPAVVRFRCEV